MQQNANKWQLITMIVTYIAAGFVLGAWGLFAWYGKTSVDGFITSLGIALSAIGGTHAHAMYAKLRGGTDPSSPSTPSQPAASSPTAAVATQ